jgi:hypothetical protein
MYEEMSIKYFEPRDSLALPVGMSRSACDSGTQQNRSTYGMQLQRPPDSGVRVTPP